MIECLIPEQSAHWHTPDCEYDEHNYYRPEDEASCRSDLTTVKVSNVSEVRLCVHVREWFGHRAETSA